jgi:hypothetical protein
MNAPNSIGLLMLRIYTFIKEWYMRTYKVTYTAYEKGSCMVASEGVIEVNTESSWQAEQTVKAIFNGLEVVIRYTN